MRPGDMGVADPSPLHALHYTDDSTAVLELSGECDCSNRAALRTAIANALILEPEKLVIDLSHLTFCEGSSAQDLLAVGRLPGVAVTGAQGIVARVLHLLDSRPTSTAAGRQTELSELHDGPPD